MIHPWYKECEKKHGKYRRINSRTGRDTQLNGPGIFSVCQMPDGSVLPKYEKHKRTTLSALIAKERREISLEKAVKGRFRCGNNPKRCAPAVRSFLMQCQRNPRSDPMCGKLQQIRKILPSDVALYIQDSWGRNGTLSKKNPFYRPKEEFSFFGFLLGRPRYSISSRPSANAIRQLRREQARY